MFVIGLTGGIASGKGTVAGFLKDKADAMIDADEIARDVIAPGTGVYKDLVKRFGPSILAADGSIERSILAGIVFSDRLSLEYLNSITHPVAIARVCRILDKMAYDPRGPKTVILMAPLLIEAGMAKRVDSLVLVVAKEATRIERLKKYRGMSKEEARARIRAQMPDEKKLGYADYTIVNDGSKDELRAEVDRVWHRIAEWDVARNV